MRTGKEWIPVIRVITQYENVNIPYKSQNKEKNNSAGYLLFNNEELRKHLYIKRWENNIKQDRLYTYKRNFEACYRNHHCH